MKNKKIMKIGLLCIKNKRLLVVHKKTINLYITPGGKIEHNETNEECLQRETREEIGCDVKDLKFFKGFKAIQPDGSVLSQECYFGQLTGDISLNLSDNIDGFLWIERNYNERKVKLAPMLEYQIIPELIKEGLL